MASWQKILLAVVVTVFGAIALLFWGSIASALAIFCLLIMGGALLYQKLITNRDEDSYWDME